MPPSPSAAPFQAVIFDLDGLLVDSEPLWHRAEIAVFGDHGHGLTEQDCLETTGLRVDAVVRHWRDRRGWDLPPGLAGEIVARMERLLSTEVNARPGAIDAVRFVHAQGIPLGLASSSPPPLIRAALRRIGLADAFAVVRSAADEARGKPDPAVYLHTVADLGADPARCLALEDSAAGIRSAVAAGLRVIAVPDQPAPPDALALAWRVLPSLVELPRIWPTLSATEPPR